jgi:hypothetical protein
MTKKKTHNNILNWMKDAWLKAIVVLLIVAGGFYAYAAITWPGDEPNPTTGVVGMFVGESTETFGQTVATKGYDKVNDLCASNPSFTGSHICTPDEMVNSYNHGKVGVAAIYTYNTTPNLWINNGPPGYTASANDCRGWTVTSRGTEDDPNFGAMWIFSKKTGGLTPCNTGKYFACCK